MIRTRGKRFGQLCSLRAGAFVARPSCTLQEFVEPASSVEFHHPPPAIHTVGRDVATGAFWSLSTLSARFGARRVVLVSPNHDLVYGEVSGGFSDRTRELSALFEGSGFNAKANQRKTILMFRRKRGGRHHYVPLVQAHSRSWFEPTKDRFGSTAAAGNRVNERLVIAVRGSKAAVPVPANPGHCLCHDPEPASG